jgi:hypothetical protein
LVVEERRSLEGGDEEERQYAPPDWGRVKPIILQVVRRGAR